MLQSEAGAWQCLRTLFVAATKILLVAYAMVVNPAREVSGSWPCDHPTAALSFSTVLAANLDDGLGQLRREAPAVDGGCTGAFKAINQQTCTCAKC